MRMVTEFVVTSTEASGGPRTLEASQRSVSSFDPTMVLLNRKRCTTTLGDFGELGWLLRRQVPRHQFIDAFLRPAVHKACQQFGEIDLRIDAIEFARLDQRSQACPVSRPFAAATKGTV